MYVRDARNRDEAWLLDHIEEMGLDGTAFRSRDYVVAVDDASSTRAGFGRIRIHTDDDGEPVACELTSIGVLDGWRGQGVGAHVIERLLRNAEIEAFEEVFTLTPEHEYLAQFGFRAVDPDDLPAQLRDRLADKRADREAEIIPMHVETDEFRMPDRLRERFKHAAEAVDDPDEEPEETPEDFGIDPDEATYKYDTGR
jgi:N-acetylglutamate synthase-like GNAT family acetyltransferase